MALAKREFTGCDDYAFDHDMLEPDLLRISERSRPRTAQSAHMVGNHMAEFNNDMRAASVVATEIESCKNAIVRRLLQMPATSLRAEREEKGRGYRDGAGKIRNGGNRPAASRY